MAIGNGDIESILSNGDFDTEAVFVIDPEDEDADLAVDGWFTNATDETVMFGQVQIEAQKPTFVCPTSLIATVRNKMSVTIGGTAYTVERIEKTGTGTSVIYLKT